jgi:hypothetical protein
MTDRPTHPMGNTLLLLAPVRFLLAWCLLLSALSWTVPWEEGWRSDRFMLFSLLTIVPLLARFSPSLFGATFAAALCIGSLTFLYCTATGHFSGSSAWGKLLALSLMISMLLRAGFALFSRLSLWRFVPTLFWGFLAWCWCDFYLQDLQYAMYRAILGAFPVFVAGFLLLRGLGQRIGALWLWAFFGLLSLGLGLFYGDNRGQGLLALASTPTLRGLIVCLVVAAFVYLAAISTKRVATKNTQQLLQDLHCGALFALAPLVVLLLWRDDHSGCFGMGRSFRETLAYTSAQLFFVGPSLFERSYRPTIQESS